MVQGPPEGDLPYVPVIRCAPRSPRETRLSLWETHVEAAPWQWGLFSPDVPSSCWRKVSLRWSIWRLAERTCWRLFIGFIALLAGSCYYIYQQVSGLDLIPIAIILVYISGDYGLKGYSSVISNFLEISRKFGQLPHSQNLESVFVSQAESRGIYRIKNLRHCGKTWY